MKKLVFALMVLLVASFLLVATSQKTSALPSDIIRIKSDGAVEGTDKIRQDGNVYTLTSNLESNVATNEAFIFIEKDGIVLDGAGYSIIGSGHGTAIYMLRMKHVVVRNFSIQGFETGINFWTVQNWPSNSKYTTLSSAFRSQIVNNKISVVGSVLESTIKERGWCIYLSDAQYTNISGNTFTSQDRKGGVYLDLTTSFTNLENNMFIGNGVYATDSNMTTAHGNMVDGKPLVFMDGVSNKVIETAGQVYLFHCNNIVVKNVRPTYDYGRTIQLVETKNSEISDCRGHVTLTNSSGNTIHDSLLTLIDVNGGSHNRIFANKIYDTGVCIKLYKSANYNEIYGNLLSDTRVSLKAEKIHKAGMNTAGIQLGDPNLGGCQYNKIHDNIIIMHDVGLEAFLSSNNTITANEIKNCKAGIQLGSSHQNNITQNNITSCTYGVSLYASSSSNKFCQNNFFGNQINCFETHLATLLAPGDAYSSNNVWDNGKLGNFYSDYTGTDANGDKIGDETYTVFENMVDHYPLIDPFIVSSFAGEGSHLVPIGQDPTVAHPTASPEATLKPEPFPTDLTVALAVVVASVVIVGLYLKKRMF
jgi:parallel beta-helix repeat protein